MNKETLKKIAYSLGKTLGILGLLFVFYKLSQEYTLSSFIEQFTLTLKILPFLFFLNFVSILIGIYAWHIMLLNYAKEPFSYSTSYYYFAKTEISKYLPGNIFHFIGRQILASKLGITQVEMAKISVLFSFFLLTATIFSSTLFAFFSQGIPPYILTLMALSSIIIVIVIGFTYTSFPIHKKVSMNISLAVSVALQGIMLGIIVIYLSEQAISIELFFLCVSIYIVSWLIGFVTPGASGGLGVREGTFIAITSYLYIDISADIIIFSVLLVRLINIFIDIILFLSTYMLKNKIKDLNI